MNIFKKIWNWIKGLLFNSKIEYKDDIKLLGWNPSCPKCRTSMGYFDTGVVEIEYDYTAGGPIGAGIHISGHGKQEYQFHYYKCGKCGNWEMCEYRETPSWWDDLWGLDCPFTKGDIIKKWENNEFYAKKYTSNKITRW